MDNARRGVKGIVVRLSGLLFLVSVWEIAPRIGLVDSDTVPPFSAVISAIGVLWIKDNLYMHMMSSIWRVLVGLLIAGATGIGLGFILGRWLEPLYLACEPLLRIFNKVNPFSLIPVFILFFGIGEGVKLAAVVWVCLWPILFATISGIKSIDPELIKIAVSMKISRLQFILKILLPGSVHSIFVGLRVGVGMSFFMLIAGEMLGANSGIGYLMHSGGHHSFDAPKLYACGVVIVVLGVIINQFLKYLQNGLFVWKEPVRIFKLTEGESRAEKIGSSEIILISIIMALILLLSSQQINKARIEAENPVERLSEEIK